MKHSAFASQICSVARTLEIVGEWWTLLIVREAFFGARRFGEFEANLGISKNVLSDRLGSLVKAGIFDHRVVPGRGNPGVYRLTEKGRDLFPTIVAMMQWGDRWAYGATRAPVRVVEKATGEAIAPLRVTSASGRPLGLSDVAIAPGPGATDMVRLRVGRGIDPS